MASTPEQIQTRHQAWLEEAGTLTMSLVRKAHARAEAQLDDPEPPPARAPARTTDHVAHFTFLVRTLRHIVATEARIVARPLVGPALAVPRPAVPVYVRSPAASDPRAFLLRRTLVQAVRLAPDATHLRRAIDVEIDRELTSDPEHKRRPGRILEIIADRLDIRVHPATLPDELLHTGDPPDD